MHIKVTGVSHQLIQVDVLFGDTLANSKHLILAVNFLGGFTRPLFAVASGSSGAWIEMSKLINTPRFKPVASGSSGAWIEIVESGLEAHQRTSSHPDLRVRGLKFTPQSHTHTVVPSHPDLRVRGLE